MGDLILRRRQVLSLDGLEVYEIILGEAFLMSSLFTAVEEALAELGLRALESYEGPFDVVVGGLGLGHTAKAALDHDSVGSLLVVDTLAEVIEWHQRHLVPLGKDLTSDSRCRFVHGDFFELAASAKPGFDAAAPERRFHAILLDVDHTPSKLLDSSHASLYTRHGLASLANHLYPGGVFAMWSDDPPDATFQADLEKVFATTEAHVVAFENPLLGTESASTVYVASKAAEE